MLGDFFYGTLHGAGITKLARRLRSGALILCYHNVIPRPLNGAPAPFGDPGLHLDLDEFARQLRWLQEHYTVVPLRDLVSRLQAGRSVRGLASITFDDGYTGAVICAWPLCLDLRLPATMFIVAGAPSEPGLFWWDHPATRDGDRPGVRDRRLLALGGDRSVIMHDAGAGATPDVPRTHLPADWYMIAEAAGAGLDLGAHTISHR